MLLLGASPTNMVTEFMQRTASAGVVRNNIICKNLRIREETYSWISLISGAYWDDGLFKITIILLIVRASAVAVTISRKDSSDWREQTGVGAEVMLGDIYHSMTIQLTIWM